MTRPGRLLGVGLLAVLPVLPACRAKGRWTEADELRRQLEETRRELASAKAERDEARAKLAEAERVRLAVGGDLAADVLEALPRCAGVEIDRLSGLSPDGAALDVYVRPFDGQRRFVQVVGTLRTRADFIPAMADGSPAGPRILASVEIGPRQLREAYRSSLMGTHYAIRLEPAQPVREAGSVAISVEFLDALSGQMHRAERVVGVRWTR